MLEKRAVERAFPNAVFITFKAESYPHFTWLR
jgi:hypothetical protein